jgi:Flp pilus assembly protein TadD
MRLSPDSARFGYVYAVGLDATGQKRAAMDVLERVLAKHPHERDARTAAISYARALGDQGGALRHARRLAELDPSNAEVQRLVRTIEAEVK